MAKIPFDIKYRPQIESGEYKVETRDGRAARIICWDLLDRIEQNIVALVQYTPEQEIIISVCKDGEYKGLYGHGYDLFIVTSEKDDIRNESHTLREWQKILSENPELAKEFEEMTPQSQFKEVLKTKEPKLTEFEYAMLRYLEEVANAKSDEEIIALTKRHSEILGGISLTEFDCF